MFEYVIGDTVCDIGCDHGKLGAELLLRDKVKDVYGIDISEASLEKSKRLKDEMELKGLHLMVGDGFEPVLNINIDCGIICGIGSNETIGIIKRSQDFAGKLKRLVLCPLKNTYTVRKYLFENGFIIVDEDMAFENGRYYNIFVCKGGEKGSFDDVDIYVGRKLIEKRHPLLMQWLNKRVNDIENSINAYDNGVKTKRFDKRDNLQKMYNVYIRGIELCK